MARLRITLLLLALGIAVPAGLIVQRALASVDLENAFRHEAVARRVFDEMERALSDFIVREEARSAEDYAAADPARFTDTDEPFVIGWFALGPDGAPRVVYARGDASRVAAAISAAWGRPDNEADMDLAAPAPGRTRRVGKKGSAEPAALDAIERQKSGTAYDVLSSLNRAQALRSERKQRAQQLSAPRARERGAGREHRLSAALEESALAEGAVRGMRQDRALYANDLLANRAEFAAPAEPEAFASFAPPAVPPREPPSIDPLIGRPSGAGELVLVRSVWRAGGAERHGVVLERAALASWLEYRVLATSGLGDRAQLEFGARSRAEHEAAEHRYVHRFAEPFDALVAQLELETLPGLGGPQPIYALAALLVAVAVVGLYAVQRGARVVVDYAQRRSDFVASVSHELKTPLTAIRMYGEMLRDGLVRDDHKRDEYYATIADESERLSRLIDNVLEFSRLEQDRRQLELVVGPLDAALREAAEKLRAHVEREGFQLRLELDEALPSVRYDRDAVTQVVFNLVDNALKYARATDRRDIVVTLRRASEGVELCVRDYGPGIPARKLRRVFEPFYRGGDELTRTAKGTGIGLALVRELAEAMGASVRGSNPSGGGFEVAIGFAVAIGFEAQA